MMTAMQMQINSFDAEQRARAKQASRVVDAQALASGRKSASQLRRENEVFGPLAPQARVNLAASRSLA
jgi:hypothetical protein